MTDTTELRETLFPPRQDNTLPPGYVLHQYRIDRVLGIGSFGITYKATHQSLDNWVAIKEYFPKAWASRDENGIQVHASHDGHQIMPETTQNCYDWGRGRFLQEAQTLHKIKHDGVVKVHDFFPANGTAYMIMDYEEGEPLSDYLKKHGPLPESELYRMLDQGLAALEAVHKKGYLHRDLKPSNLFIRSRDNRLMLIDFGAARPTVSGNSSALTKIWTPGYAPLEQFKDTGAQQGPWTDLYALGAVLYECISGKPPLDARDREVNDPLRPAIHIGEGKYNDSFLQVVDRALQTSPQARYQSADEMRRALPGLSSTFKRRRSLLKRSLAILAVLIIGFAAAFYVLHFQEGRLLPKATAQLKIDITPADANIEIINLGLTYRHGMKLEPGDYELEFSYPGYQPLRRRYAFNKGQQTLSVALSPLDFSQPQMVLIQGGHYRIGSPASEPGHDDDEQQTATDTFIDDFYLAKHEVTVRDFRQFVDETGYRTRAESGEGCGPWPGVRPLKKQGKDWRKPGFTQSDNHPVVCISWNDAMAYIDWFSSKTATNYRLPSEAEWEYAARAGRSSSRYWGDNPDDSCRYANVLDLSAGQEVEKADDVANCRDGYAYTAPVGHYQPNALGLHDMLGNVWEWTCSRYAKRYEGAEKVCIDQEYADQSNVSQKKIDQARRVIRGGAWRDEPTRVRAASRLGVAPDQPLYRLGFRLARSE